MSEERKPKKGSFFGMGFEEALARLIGTNPKELADTYEQVRRDEEEVDKYVAERERSIGKGARRAGKRFRL